MEIKVKVESHLEDGTILYRISGIPNPQAKRVVQDILPDVLKLYLEKSRDYGGNVMQLASLGPKACFPDMWRKMGKLRSALWEEKPMVGEQKEEILSDLVGHTLIVLDELMQERKIEYIHTIHTSSSSEQ